MALNKLSLLHTNGLDVYKFVARDRTGIKPKFAEIDLTVKYVTFVTE